MAHDCEFPCPICDPPRASINSKDDPLGPIPLDQNRCDYCSVHFPKGDHEMGCRACAEFSTLPPVLWIAPSDVRELAKNNPDRMDIAIPFYPKSYHLREVALLLNKASHPGTWLDGSDEVLRVIEKARGLLLEIMDR